MLINKYDQNLGVWWLGMILEHDVLELVREWYVIFLNRLHNHA